MDLDLKQMVAMVDIISEEKNLPKETVIDVIQQAIAAAWRKDNGDKDMDVRCELDLNSGEADVYVVREVIEDDVAYNPATEIPQSEAGGKEIGDHIEEKHRVTGFGRVASQTAKQVVLQRLRDAERDAAYKLGMCGNAKMEELATMCYNMCKEMAALKSFKCDVLKEKTEFAVSQILAEVKQDLPTDKYAELEEKSKNCAYEDVDQFRITAQAFAYQHGVSRAKPEDDGHLHMTFGNVGEQSGEYDVFADILGK